MCACTDLLTPALNPQFLEAIGVVPSAASIPGEAPTLLVEFENRISQPIEFRLTWRSSEEEVKERIRALAPNEKYAEAIVCPILELTVGDVGDLTQVGVVVRLGNGTVDDPVLEVEPFGILLQEGVHYDCGDSITFSVQPSQRTLSGFQVFATIRRFGG